MPVQKNRWLWVGLAAVLVVGSSTLLYYRVMDRTGDAGETHAIAPISFAGTSDQLQQTVVLPTLDTSIPEGRSAIWCVSFQLAWNHLKDDVAKAPLQLANAQEVADRLNKANHAETDVGADAVYAAAGLAKDDIVERIQTQMARRFPNVPTTSLAVPVNGAVAYAFLAAATKFEFPFFENDEPLLFTDRAGRQTAVASFGIRQKDDYAYERLRAQVAVLFASHHDLGREQEVSEFILDLCKTSKPYQILLARIDRQATLADTLSMVEQKLKEKSADTIFPGRFGPRDTLLVPNMAWKVSHRFRDLEGIDKQFQNPALRGLYLDTALQTIQFRLDRNGAELAAESKVLVKPPMSCFHVNRPFLLIMKKREEQRPFFVMWVDNAELMQPR